MSGWMTRIGFAAAILLGVMGVETARAWPELPPVKAFLSGPGLEGRVEITDPDVLATLRLGGLEDMETGRVKEPESPGEGYEIVRYFEEGEFRYGDLVYYPARGGEHGLVYFEDGPDTVGDHSPFHKTWLLTTTEGERTFSRYLESLGVEPDGSSTLASKPAEPKLTDVLVAGVPAEIYPWDQFEVRVEFNRPVLDVRVSARLKGTAREIQIPTRVGGGGRSYIATFELEDPGVWEWVIRANGNTVELPQTPLVVIDPNAAVQDKPADTSGMAASASKEVTATQNGIGLNAAAPWVAAAVGVIGLVGAVWMRRANQGGRRQ
jgi:hypothetical protein